jgi:septal ring factor EnvC (AmiA/AmiB activator)
VLQVRHEVLTGVMEKLESELGSAQRSIETTQGKAQHLAQVFLKLEKAQASMEERLKRRALEKKALQAEAATSDKAFMKTVAQNNEVEEKLVAVLGEQTTVGKGAGGTAKNIQRVRKEVRTAALDSRVESFGDPTHESMLLAVFQGQER